MGPTADLPVTDSTSAASTAPPILGVLGGSGLYDLDGLHDVREEHVDTPFGQPSGPLVFGTLGGARVVFLSRHGRGHRLSPSEINYRANVHAMKQVGVRRLLSISAVGSLREGIVPGHLVLPDQFIDKTFRRANTFFGDGIVGHVSFAQPVCSEFSALVVDAAAAAGCPLAGPEDRLVTPAHGRRESRLHRGGTYVCMEGPQFSTRAESLLHRSWGADVIGMTAAPEAKLAREAELCFALLALSTDYDCWHPSEDAVTAVSVVEVLKANIARAQELVSVLAARTSAPGACGCGRAAEFAVLTARDAIPQHARERLHTLYGRYL